jgi:hypothetical protein
MRSVELAPMESQLRKLLARDADVRVALVVAEQDVVARLERLDQVVLEQQRLAFRTRHGRLDTRDLADHHRDPGLVRALLEVVRDPFPQVARLADVERVAGGVEHPVDARPMRQRRDELARVERRRVAGVAPRRRRRWRRHARETRHLRHDALRPVGADARRSRRTPRGTSPA